MRCLFTRNGDIARSAASVPASISAWLADAMNA